MLALRGWLRLGHCSVAGVECGAFMRSAEVFSSHQRRGVFDGVEKKQRRFAGALAQYCGLEWRAGGRRDWRGASGEAEGRVRPEKIKKPIPLELEPAAMRRRWARLLMWASGRRGILRGLAAARRA